MSVRAAAELRPGDLLVLYAGRGRKVAVHAAVDLVGGWVLTKNGEQTERPYRFQRWEVTRRLYNLRIHQLRRPAPFEPLGVARLRKVK